jgi:hypothetical protein
VRFLIGWDETLLSLTARALQWLYDWLSVEKPLALKALATAYLVCGAICWERERPGPLHWIGLLLILVIATLMFFEAYCPGIPRRRRSGETLLLQAPQMDFWMFIRLWVQVFLWLDIGLWSWDRPAVDLCWLAYLYVAAAEPPNGPKGGKRLRLREQLWAASAVPTGSEC